MTASKVLSIATRFIKLWFGWWVFSCFVFVVWGTRAQWEQAQALVACIRMAWGCCGCLHLLQPSAAPKCLQSS